MKAQTLRETNLVFSGLVALGTRPEDSEYWKLATTFGATCSNQLSPKTTHLVANQPGTAKVHSAKRFPRVKVVYPQWLLDSVARWVRLEEGPYLLPTVEEQRPATTPPSPVRPELSDGESEAKTTAAVETAGNDAVDLDLADLDWGDAMKEVDDLLLETDDDDDLASLLNGAGGDDETTTDGESDTGGGSSVGGGGGRGRKRPRVSSTPSSESVGSNAATSSSTAAAESPLQKRVKTARSRRSGLKTSLSASAAATAATAAAEGDASAQPSAPLPSESAQSPNGKNALKGDLAVAAAAVAADETAAADLSQASSSIGSDDEDLLAMAADLESGWS